MDISGQLLTEQQRDVTPFDSLYEVEGVVLLIYMFLCQSCSVYFAFIFHDIYANNDDTHITLMIHKMH